MANRERTGDVWCQNNATWSPRRRLRGSWPLRVGLNFTFEIGSRSGSGSAILCELGVLFRGEVHEDPAPSV